MAQFIPTEQQTAAQLCPIVPNRVKPVVEADSCDNKWIIFQDTWSLYKQMTSLTKWNSKRTTIRVHLIGKRNAFLILLALMPSTKPQNNSSWSTLNPSQWSPFTQKFTDSRF